jgi:thiosulfate reductase cytochrome b subunit
MAERLYLFKRFERFWHWSQAALIITMLITGFEIHGSYQLAGFKQAVGIHTTAAWALIILWVFAIFWHFTTGEWRQYIPTFKNVDVMFRYYVLGIFTGAPQRLSYLGVKLFINPLIWASGLGLLYYHAWRDLAPAGLSLATVAWLHTVMAFVMLIFLIVHVYLTTTGHTPLAHIRAMISGYEDVED